MQVKPKQDKRKGIMIKLLIINRLCSDCYNNYVLAIIDGREEG